MFIGGAGKQSVQQEPWDWDQIPVGLLKSLLRHVLYEVGEPLVDMSDIERCLNYVHKVVNQSRRNDRSEKSTGVFSGNLVMNVARSVLSFSS